MRNPIGPFMVTTLLLITFLLLTNYAFGKTKSEWLSENPCMIKIVITEKCLDSECLISETTKEEVLKCRKVRESIIKYTTRNKSRWRWYNSTW